MRLLTIDPSLFPNLKVRAARRKNSILFVEAVSTHRPEYCRCGKDLYRYHTRFRRVRDWIGEPVVLTLSVDRYRCEGGETCEPVSDDLCLVVSPRFPSITQRLETEAVRLLESGEPLGAIAQRLRIGASLIRAIRINRGIHPGKRGRKSAHDSR